VTCHSVTAGAKVAEQIRIATPPKRTPDRLQVITMIGIDSPKKELHLNESGRIREQRSLPSTSAMDQ